MTQIDQMPASADRWEDMPRVSRWGLYVGQALIAVPVFLAIGFVVLDGAAYRAVGETMTMAAMLVWLPLSFLMMPLFLWLARTGRAPWLSEDAALCASLGQAAPLAAMLGLTAIDPGLETALNLVRFLSVTVGFWAATGVLLWYLRRDDA